MNTDTGLQHGFSVTQLCEERADSFWQWTLMIEADEGRLGEIDEVTYILDSSISNPVRKVKDARTGFATTGLAWASFNADAVIHLKNSEQVQLAFELILETATGSAFALTFQDGTPKAILRIDIPKTLQEHVKEVTYRLSSEKVPASVEGYDRKALQTLAAADDNLFVDAELRLQNGRKLIIRKHLGTMGELSKRELIDSARTALLGEARTSKELDKLCKDLEKADQFDYASELLKLRMKQDEAEGKRPALADQQRLARYIYKDNSLSSDFKFDRALQILNAADPLAESESCETLGAVGAIYKRKWQYDHQHKHLDLALHFYEQGFKLWKKYLDGDTRASLNDDGWNAINYAFILELEATNELEETGSASGFKNFGADGLMKAHETRIYILERFVDDPFGSPALRSVEYPTWVLATVVEAYFGLCRYKEALYFIEQYKSRVLTQPWELRTFGKQLFSIAYLQQAREKITQSVDPWLAYNQPKEAGEINDAQIRRCLGALDIQSDEREAVKNEGKTGLALSGGGFRASLFHIGVFAAMAERDELKNIEVISCVSGGSIIGAYYYLKLKLLLEEKTDEEISTQDYIDLVKEIEVEFLKGVQENLRMRIFSDLGANFRMLKDDYSRTSRLGELYEEYLYIPIFERHLEKLEGNEIKLEAARKKYGAFLGKKPERRICMNDLFISPDDDFDFANDNWKRNNKVPQLILNATSVNTGHNWQFTASWMGEPAAGIIADIDVKSRLRRMYYADAPEGYREFPIGYAVGASSCVPVMFEPLPMKDLYPGIDLQLIDGGLHDNQGIASILEEECRNVFISDASGQLPTNSESVGSLVSLFMRSDNILQERVRELQFLDMKERKSTTLINSLVQVHLKNGITTPTVNWKYCTDPPRTISHADPTVKDKDLMPYGVQRGLQELVSQIRTDLDAFHDVEAFALMHNGYAQAHYEIGRATNGEVHPEKGRNWRFLSIESYMENPERADKIRTLLTVASKVPFKVYHLLSKPVKIILMVIGFLIAATLVYLVCSLEPEIKISTTALAVSLVILIVGSFFRWASVILDPKAYARKWIVRVCVAIVGWVIFNGYLKLFNGRYLKAGKLDEKA